MRNPKALYRSSISRRRSLQGRIAAGARGPKGEFYKDIIDEIAEGIVSVDPAGRILFANKAASKMLDISAAQIVGHHFTDFIDRQSLAQSLRFFRQVTEGKTIIQQVINIKDNNDRVLPVEFSASPNIENGRVVQIHSVFRNIAARKEMEALMLESEKMTAVQHFITGTAQEIRNPLKGISDKLDKILYEYERRDFEYIGYKELKGIFELIRHMRDEARYCFETTQRLLDISKRKIGKDELYCRIPGVIKDICDRLEAGIQDSNTQISVKLAKDLPEVRIGAIELSQVLGHVLRNAVQSITHDGKITIKARYTATDQMVTVECVDNGIGISKENLSRIYEPFYTTKPRSLGGGGGLGLSIVYSIVKKHKGDIRVTSSLREGTRVILRFPAKKKKELTLNPAMLAPVDKRFMLEALKMAGRAFELDEVPVGAVIVHKGEILAKAHNQVETLKDPTAHAEMIAITQATNALKAKWLHDCTMYVTIEPCSMCAGALVLARLQRLVYAAKDPKTGACGSVVNIARHKKLNHRMEIKGGILGKEAGMLISEFFEQKRAKKLSEKS